MSVVPSPALLDAAARVSLPPACRRSSTRCATFCRHAPDGCTSPTTPCAASSRSTRAAPSASPSRSPALMAGRAFMSGELLVSEPTPTVVSVPLVDGSDRIGLLELDYERWDDACPPCSIRSSWCSCWCSWPTAATAIWARARRSEPLSAAAEIQWDLLPPLSCSTSDVAVGGILEPAYSIGGDSFDYALNGRRLEFAIVDAIGHGMSAVLMSAAAINGLRNVRRAGTDVSAAYEQVDRLIATQFGDSYYVTGQVGVARPLRPACSRGSTPGTCRRCWSATAPTPASWRAHRRCRSAWADRWWRWQRNPCNAATGCCSTRTASPNRDRPTGLLRP